MSSASCYDHEPPRKRQKLPNKSQMSAKPTMIQNDNSPPYKSMDDLHFADYKPIFSRRHLQSCDLSKLRITLTPQETETFSEIKKAINNKAIFDKPVTVRCAGGWVRDKLLKCHSNDIDLAIDTMTGEQFGDRLQRYFHDTKKQTLHIGKIAQNPDKSKHLASVTFRIGTIEFDVVNLRTERYTEESRIPVMAFGTAKEDALRRDLTINALFYNLNEDRIEDWTGKGIADMVDGIARTPLNAMITYKDDPLRVLRNIRHGVTRFGFTLHGDIVVAAQHPHIHQLLRSKVSRERFAIEFEKMLKGYNVWIAMHCLIKFGLAPILFEIPSGKEDTNVPHTFGGMEAAWKESLRLTKHLTQIIMHSCEKEEEKKEKSGGSIGYDLSSCFGVDRAQGKEIQKELLFAAFTYPFHGITVNQKKKKKKKKAQSLVMYFVTQSMPGMPNASKLGETVHVYHRATQLLVQLLLRLKRSSGEKQVSNKEMSLECGKFLRLTKHRWKYCMFLVKSVCSIHYPIAMDSNTIDGLVSWIATKSNLLHCWDWKPLLNGSELVKRYEAYGLRRDWRIGKINEFILEERLAKPSTTIAQLNGKIIEWLKDNPAPNINPTKRSNKKSNKNKRNSNK